MHQLPLQDTNNYIELMHHIQEFEWTHRNKPVAMINCW